MAAAGFLAFLFGSKMGVKFQSKFQKVVFYFKPASRSVFYILFEVSIGGSHYHMPSQVLLPGTTYVFEVIMKTWKSSYCE
jgi:hypothetical protein